MEKSGKIKIVVCRAFGDVFANITPGSVHEVIEPPEKYKYSKSTHEGVWVMGVGVPVRVLTSEYIILD